MFSTVFNKLFRIRLKQFLIVCLVFNALIGYAQNFSEVERIVSTYPNKIATINGLTNLILEDFPDPKSQVMAIYTWIGTHIQYNLNEYKYGSDSYSFRYASQEELMQKIKERDLSIVGSTLQSQRAVCEGYAKTFHLACETLKIPSVVISGYSRTGASTIGKLPLSEKHAWNAVKIENTWQLIDVTWGAGYSENNEYWTPHFDPYFCFTPPHEFIGSHFPIEKKWQLLASPVSEKAFASQPIYSAYYYTLGAQLVAPKQGVLNSLKNESYLIQLTGLDPATELGYAYEKDYYLTTIIPEFSDGIATLKVPAKEKKNTFLNLLVENKMIVRFYIE